MTGGSAAVQGIAMLNPQRWGGSGGGTGGTTAGVSYSKNLEKDNGMLFEVDEEEEDYVPAFKGTTTDKSSTFLLPFSPFFFSIKNFIGRFRSFALAARNNIPNTPHGKQRCLATSK